MVIQLQTSFIPKKAPVLAPTTFGVRVRSVNFFGVFSLVVFFLTIGLSALVFFYKANLISLISDMDTTLASAKKSFEPEFINDASRLNARIEGALELLNSHRALSPLFDILENKTLETVRFQDLNFTALKGQEATVSMTGQAQSFNAVALQSDVFGAERSFKDPIFSNFALNERGDVIFNFKTTVMPELLQYRETVLGSKDSGATGASPLDGE